MKSIDELTSLFKSFPGVGPRQARRFVYHLLTAPSDQASRIALLIKSLKEETALCKDCQRLFAKNVKHTGLCKECSDDTRDVSLLAVIPRDSDREALEKSGMYRGYYFVLGGSIPILGDEPEKKVRLHSLYNAIKAKAKKGLKEVIIAMNANPEGDHTADIVARYITSLAHELSITVTTLGRGLSTGTELEYADTDTIKNALKNRSASSFSE